MGEQSVPCSIVRPIQAEFSAAEPNLGNQDKHLISGRLPPAVVRLIQAASGQCSTGWHGPMRSHGEYFQEQSLPIGTQRNFEFCICIFLDLCYRVFIPVVEATETPSRPGEVCVTGLPARTAPTFVPSFFARRIPVTPLFTFPSPFRLTLAPAGRPSGSPIGLGQAPASKAGPPSRPATR